MTRSPGKASAIAALGAHPVVCDVFDTVALDDAVVGFAPDLVMHQLTDLPDHLDEIADYASRNNRSRTEATRNLLAASAAAGTRRFLAQRLLRMPAVRAVSSGAGPGGHREDLVVRVVRLTRLPGFSDLFDEHYFLGRRPLGQVSRI